MAWARARFVSCGGSVTLQMPQGCCVVVVGRPCRHGHVNEGPGPGISVLSRSLKDMQSDSEVLCLHSYLHFCATTLAPVPQCLSYKPDQ